MNIGLPRAVSRLLLILAVVLHGPCAAAAETTVPAPHRADWTVRTAPDQRQFLQAHREWRVGVVLQAPYASHVPRQSQPAGFDIDLMEQLAAALDVRVAWRAYADADALERARAAGDIDLAMGRVQTPAGLRHWDYSAPYLRIPRILAGLRASSAGPVQIDELPADEPLAVASPAVAEFLRVVYFRSNLLQMASEREALRAVLRAQASYAVIDEPRLVHLMREPEFAALARSGDIGYPRLLRIAVRKDWQPAPAILDLALASMPGSAMSALQERWIRPDVPGPGESQALWRNLALLAGVLLVAAAVAAAALRRRYHAVESRLASARHDLEQLQQGQQRLHLTQFTVDESALGTLWVGWDGRICYANRSAGRMLAATPGQLLGRPLRDVESTLDMDGWLALWRDAREAGGERRTLETTCTRLDGTRFPADISLNYLRGAQGEYLLVFLADVTEQRRARAALQESEARLKGIAGNVPGLVFRLERPAEGQEPDFAFLSEGAIGLTGYAPAVLMHPDWGIRGVVHPQDLASYDATKGEALAAERDWRWQGRIVTRGGESRWIDLRATARAMGGGRAVWDGVAWDITESKRTELELAESRSQLRELAAHLESVREEEKARIAREVHDELGQVLTVLRLETTLCELGYGAQDAGLAARLAGMKKLIGQLFQLVRDVATALRPPILDAGLGSAIEWQAHRFESRSGITCLVDVPDVPLDLPPPMAIGLFRILQEALTNVLRHAQAHTVSVRLAAGHGALSLTITDDGVGFDPATLGARASFGLVGMRERVQMLGGKLALDSQPGEGTTLSILVPMPLREAA